MAKINQKSLTKVSTSMNIEERLAGGMGLASAINTPEQLLRRCVLANLLWENVAYQDGKIITDEINKLIPLCSPQVVAEIAVESRHKQKLRHIGLHLIVQMLKHPKHKELVGEIVPKICTRADQLTDLVALYWKENPKKTGTKNAPLAKQLSKGIASSLNNFTEYQFAKYNRPTEVKFRDLLFLTHPKAKSVEQQGLFDKIVNNNLQTPDTWEVELSASKDKKSSWTRLLREKKLGALALLRNIRNMSEAGVSHSLIRNGITSANGKMLLPLNYYSAFVENKDYAPEIEKLMVNSYKQLPKLKGRTLFIVDVSGSMMSRVSDKSDRSRLDVAKAMILAGIMQCEDFEVVCTAGGGWSNGHKTELIKTPNLGFGLFNQIDNLRSILGGGGIFTRQALEWCKSNIQGNFDRVLVFSDSQDCDNVNKVPKPFGTYNYVIDISSHTRGINYKGVWTAEISGWSENFLNFISALEGNEVHQTVEETVFK